MYNYSLCNGAIGVAAAVNRSNEAATERAYFCSVFVCFFLVFFNFRKTQKQLLGPESDRTVGHVTLK